MPAAGVEARAEHHVGQALLQRCQQRRPVPGVVLEIGVLHEHEGGRHLGEAATHGRTLPPVAGLPVQVAVNVTGTPGTGAALDDVTVHTGAPAAGCAAGMLAEQNAIGRATLPLPSST